MASAIAINEFLAQRASALRSSSVAHTIVMGNEAGDMDSVVGSIYLAMLLDKDKSYGFENPLPVLNFPRADLALRNDVVKYLGEQGVDISLLLSVVGASSISLGGSSQQIILYDHNKLTASQSSCGKNVAGVVDHHKDEEQYVDQTKKLRILRTVGSACTLVAEMYQKACIPVPCAELLLAPIILDTVNFEPAQKKVTPEDIAAYEWLRAQESCGPVNAEELYGKLAKWKNDVLALTASENIRRDYKKFDFPCPSRKSKNLSVGTSSVPCSCAEFEAHYTTEGILKSAVEFLKEHSVETLVYAFAGKVNGKHSREVGFCAESSVLDIFSPFVSESPDGISFTKMSEAKMECDGVKYAYISYSLSDPAVSRKKLVPALAAFLSEGKWSLL